MANVYKVNFDINPPIFIRVKEEEKMIDMDMGLEISGQYSYSISDDIAFFVQKVDIDNPEKRAEFEGRILQSIHCNMGLFWAEKANSGITHDDIPNLFEELKEYIFKDMQGGFCKSNGILLESLEFTKSKINDEDERAYSEMKTGFDKMNEINSIQKRINEMKAEMSTVSDPDRIKSMTEEVQKLQMRFVSLSMGAAAPAVNPTNDNEETTFIPQTKIPPRTKYKWQCPCGRINDTSFCPGCGRPKDATSVLWICSCGKKNNTNFCTNCGNKRG